MNEWIFQRWCLKFWNLVEATRRFSFYLRHRIARNMKSEFASGCGCAGRQAGVWSFKNSCSICTTYTVHCCELYCGQQFLGWFVRCLRLACQNQEVSTFVCCDTIAIDYSTTLSPWPLSRKNFHWLFFSCWMQLEKEINNNALSILQHTVL
jgi:hypothetical protein